nr:STAS domain-containing protein [Kibdelosporangium sp. MJ126-NF4]CEL17532.1 hypothetical protein [Kibdelosporangium sp. MJ126-NF4]CTQ91242.1 hypothetical protein [Kibdelosporangium sp. MJ126-NF4]
MTQHTEPRLEWATERHEQTMVVHFVGEIDVDTQQTFEEAVRVGLASVAPVVILDLAKVTFLGSTGLRVLVTAHNETLDAGRALRLVHGSSVVHRVLEITGLEQVLDLYPAVKEALAM